MFSNKMDFSCLQLRLVLKSPVTYAKHQSNFMKPSAHWPVAGMPLFQKFIACKLHCLTLVKPCVEDNI